MPEVEYGLDYLPMALTDILEAELSLFEFSPAAADKFSDEIFKLADTLREYPYLYPVYEHNDYFRSMPLPYKYRLFYHVDEDFETVKVHRILHGMRDIENIL